VVTNDVAADALVIARAEERHLKGAARRYRAKKTKETAARGNGTKEARSDLKVMTPMTRAGLVGRPRASAKHKVVGMAAVRGKRTKKARRSELEGRPNGPLK
jgi:hypothetical protein